MNPPLSPPKPVTSWGILDVQIPLEILAHPTGGSTHPFIGGNIFTARKRSLGQGNIFSSVCQELCSSVCWDTTPQDQALQPDQAPPTPQGPGTTPPDQAHTPLAQRMLGDTVNERVVCILLECNLITDSF